MATIKLLTHKERKTERKTYTTFLIIPLSTPIAHIHLEKFFFLCLLERNRKNLSQHQITSKKGKVFLWKKKRFFTENAFSSYEISSFYNHRHVFFSQKFSPANFCLILSPKNVTLWLRSPFGRCSLWFEKFLISIHLMEIPA